MTSVASRGSRSTKKPAVNKKLLYVLGAVFALVLGMKVMPGLLGGGGATAAFKPPATTFHFHKTPVVGPGGAGGGVAVPRTSRDPFAPPPGYAASH